MKKLNGSIWCFILIWFTQPAFAAEFQAKVIHVTDGDTITVLKENKQQVRIRLNGIDCPERGQAYEKKATDFTKDLVALQTVTIQIFGQDEFARTIGEVMLEDGRNLNQELVKHGWCWWYRKNAPGNLVLMKMEADAKEAKLGLWKDPDPTPPWVFRYGGGQQAFEVESSPTPLYQDLAIRGNKRSRKYHRADCPNYDDIAPHNRIPFSSAQEAEEAGFTLAGNCP